MSLLQIHDGQVQVSLRGLQFVMSQHLLHVAEVGSILEHVRSAGVPPEMTGDVRPEASDLGGLANEFAHGGRAQSVVSGGGSLDLCRVCR